MSEVGVVFLFVDLLHLPQTDMAAAAKRGRAAQTSTATGKPQAKRRSRAKAGANNPGKISWIHGTKLKFFALRSEEWKAANEMGVVEVGKFYTKITNLYLLKYGDLKDNEDLKDDVPDPTDPDAPLPGAAEMSAEQAAEQSEYMQSIRKVRRTKLLRVVGN